jgi:hypothetical protein
MSYIAGHERKWISCFDGFQAILYCVDLSRFDAIITDNLPHPMHQALCDFENLMNSHHFHNGCYMLFLNKFDIFEEKILRGVSLRFNSLLRIFFVDVSCLSLGRRFLITLVVPM